MEKDVFYNAIY